MSIARYPEMNAAAMPAIMDAGRRDENLAADSLVREC